mmetsp:Transcript_10727/g.34003  ORF Transcript_10727/g.34003 Transcript_10727/m.34003 type:complete len:240 (+) Transcript_10727:1613-2332(+)
MTFTVATQFTRPRLSYRPRATHVLCNDRLAVTNGEEQASGRETQKGFVAMLNLVLFVASHLAANGCLLRSHPRLMLSVGSKAVGGSTLRSSCVRSATAQKRTSDATAHKPIARRLRRHSLSSLGARPLHKMVLVHWRRVHTRTTQFYTYVIRCICNMKALTFRRIHIVHNTRHNVDSVHVLVGHRGKHQRRHAIVAFTSRPELTKRLHIEHESTQLLLIISIQRNIPRMKVIKKVRLLH